LVIMATKAKKKLKTFKAKSKALQAATGKSEEESNAIIAAKERPKYGKKRFAEMSARGRKKAQKA
jgi:hypothetical protein